MEVNIYLPQIESGLENAKIALSNEARELSQRIISNLRLDNQISIEVDKRVLGEICRALRIESNYAELGNQWYYRFYKDSNLESCVLVQTPISIFEKLNKQQ